MSYYENGQNIAKKYFNKGGEPPATINYLNSDVQAGFWDEWKRLKETPPSSAGSLVERVAHLMAIAYARGRFNVVAESKEKEELIKMEADQTWKRWESAARHSLETGNHI